MAPKTKMASKSRKSSALFASNNFQANFSGKNFEGTDIQLMAAALRSSSLNVFFQCASTNTPQRYISHAYQSASINKDSDILSFKLVDDSTETLTKYRFVSLLGGHDGIPASELPPVYESSPTDDELSSFLEEIGYEDNPAPLGDLKRPSSRHPGTWRFILCSDASPGRREAQTPSTRTF